mgnify:CR=1 FL=1
MQIAGELLLVSLRLQGVSRRRLGALASGRSLECGGLPKSDTGWTHGDIGARIAVPCVLTPGAGMRRGDSDVAVFAGDSWPRLTAPSAVS